MDEQNNGRPFKEQAEDLLQRRGAVKADVKHWSIGNADFLVQDGSWSVNEWWPFAHWTANGTTIASLERFLTVFAAEAEAALLRQALQSAANALKGAAKVFSHHKLSLGTGNTLEAATASERMLSDTTAGQSLLDRIKALEDMLPTPVELRALDAAATLLEGESFDAEAAAVRGYLGRLAKVLEASKGAGAGG